MTYVQQNPNLYIPFPELFLQFIFAIQCGLFRLYSLSDRFTGSQAIRISSGPDCGQSVSKFDLYSGSFCARFRKRWGRGWAFQIRLSTSLPSLLENPFIGLRVNGESLTPRQRLLMAPLALESVTSLSSKSSEFSLLAQRALSVDQVLFSQESILAEFAQSSVHSVLSQSSVFAHAAETANFAVQAGIANRAINSENVGGLSPNVLLDMINEKKELNQVNGVIQFAATSSISVLTHSANLGIGVSMPMRNLHLSDTLRIEPRELPPANPAMGDVYVDNSGAYCVFLSGKWHRSAGDGFCGLRNVTVSPNPGSFNVDTFVSLESPDGGRIFFTQNGEDPTILSSQYTGPIHLTTITTIKALTERDGNLSEISEFHYNVNLIHFSISPRSISFLEAPTVTIDLQGTGQIYYTVDGSDPTTRSLLYTGPFQEQESFLAKAIVVDGSFQSPVVSQQFYIWPDGIGEWKNPNKSNQRLSIFVLDSNTGGLIDQNAHQDRENYLEEFVVINSFENQQLGHVLNNNGSEYSSSAQFELDISESLPPGHPDFFKRNLIDVRTQFYFTMYTNLWGSIDSVGIPQAPTVLGVSAPKERSDTTQVIRIPGFLHFKIAKFDKNRSWANCSAFGSPCIFWDSGASGTLLPHRNASAFTGLPSGFHDGANGPNKFELRNINPSSSTLSGDLTLRFTGASEFQVISNGSTLQTTTIADGQQDSFHRVQNLEFVIHREGASLVPTNVNANGLTGTQIVIEDLVPAARQY